MELWKASESDREARMRRHDFLMGAAIIIPLFAVLGWGYLINIRQEAKLAEDARAVAPANEARP